MQNLKDNKMTPLVSVLCQAYNHGEFIEQCLKGIMMQETSFSFEILVHDDASTDNTADIIKKFELQYPEIIKPIYQTENQFSQKKKVFSDIQIPRAKGKYIAICEGDDYWTDPLKLQKQVDFLETNSGFSFCAGRVKYYFQENKEMKDDYQVKQFDGSGIGLEVCLENLFTPYIIRTCTLLFNSEYINSVNGSKYKYFKDIFLFAVLLSKGKGFVFNELFAVYRKHNGGIWTGSSKTDRLQADINTLEEMDMYFSHKAKSIIEFKELRIKELQIEKDKIKKPTFLMKIIKHILNIFKIST